MLYQTIKNNSCRLVVLLLCLGFASSVYATHNRAGEISYVSAPLPGEPYRYIFSINTYTKISGGGAAAADRDTLDIDFGDGSPLGRAPRINGAGNGVTIANNIRFNIYEIAHSYPAPFDYVVSMQDPNRIQDIINIQFGESVEIPFYIEDTLFFRDPQFFGFNSSPILLQPPIDFGNVGYPFLHNPNAFDPDGDSLRFELIPPKSDPFNDVPVYAYPDEIFPGGVTPDPSINSININPLTGELIWDSPQVAGIYNIAILISEYRNGVKMSTVVRDMQIIVEETNNTPPILQSINDTCILVGETLDIMVSATDNDVPIQNVSLTAFGGPFELDFSPAVFNVIASSPPNAQGNFTWTTICNHIYSQNYTVVFKAEDDYSQGAQELPLTDLETWLIQLAPPPVENLAADIVNQAITLNWDSHICEEDDKFRGYSVWRSVGCDSLVIERCDLSLEGTNYVKLAEGITQTIYVDETATPGIFYSYRIVAEFANSFTNTNPPTPLNVVSSMASDNVCIELPKDVPIITNVSVVNTDPNAGEIYVAWTKPRADALDTTVNTPPYRYELYRTTGIATNDFTLVNTWNYPDFASANDTIFNDTGLNTVDNPYSYKVAFYSNNELVGETPVASSVYLNIEPSDNTLALSWDFSVPWLNFEYVVYQENEGNFIAIDTTDTNSYLNENLTNGIEYCYYIEAYGTYASPDLPTPLINLSQELCATPIDTVAPCAPSLSVTNGCEDDFVDTPDFFSNLLNWTNDINIGCDNDIVGYQVYYQSPLAVEYELIAQIDNQVITFFEHVLNNSLAGCYAVTAVDSFSNESPFSNVVCVENCLDFELPNAFTPNGDGDNELFIPRASRFVSSIDMKIFNQWGGLVYETNDPLINWDGTDLASGQPVSEGVYFYNCNVFERSSDGLERVSVTLNGFIQVIR